MRLTRRAWLASVSAAGAVFGGRMEPGLILHSGNVITMDAENPRAQAVAIVGDRIFAVGSDDDILHLETCAICASEYDFEQTVLDDVRGKLRRIRAPGDLMSRISSLIASTRWAGSDPA